MAYVNIGDLELWDKQTNQVGWIYEFSYDKITELFKMIRSAGIHLSISKEDGIKLEKFFSQVCRWWLVN